MYFNEKEDTNIDNVFNEKEKKESFFKKYKLFIIIGIVVLLIVGFVVFLLTMNKCYIDLTGDESITIYQGSSYVEFGYYGYDKKGNDLTSEVVVTSDVDTSILGEYTVTYALKNKKVYRKVTVVEKATGDIYINLQGDDVVYVSIGTEYVEPGYTAIDTIDGNITGNVEIESNVDTSKAGSYTIIYSVMNSSGITGSTLRKVIVMDGNLKLSLSNSNYTNGSVDINIQVSDNYFDYLILPNGNRVSKNNYTYKVSANGTYEFTAYNTKGLVTTESITVSNIDTTNPTGSCTGYYKNGKSYITVSANDNSGIGKYIISGNTYTANEITLDSEVSSVSVAIYDKAGNNTTASCSLSNENVDGWIFIGDSRMNGMKSAVTVSGDVNFVVKNSQKIAWLDTAVTEVNKILSSNSGKRYYIYCNLGIFDIIKNTTVDVTLANKLNALASGDWKDHEVGFISVNPMAGKAKYGGTNYSSKESLIVEFNDKQKAALTNVHYCDTYNGIGKDNFSAKSSSDGLNYSNDTYNNIYNYIINNCAF